MYKVKYYYLQYCGKSNSKILGLSYIVNLSDIFKGIYLQNRGFLIVLLWIKICFFLLNLNISIVFFLEEWCIIIVNVSFFDFNEI